MKFALGAMVMLSAIFGLFASLAQKPVKILAVGDSLTFGVDDSAPRISKNGGYRYVAARLLGPRYMWVGSHDNCEGYPGIQASELEKSLPGWLKTYDPAVVVLMAGVNDIGNHRAPSEAVASLRNMINECHGRRVIVIAPHVLPRYAELDREVAEMVQRHNVEWLDLRELKWDRSDFGVKDFHYSPSGYRKIGEAVAAQINKGR